MSLSRSGFGRRHLAMVLTTVALGWTSTAFADRQPATSDPLLKLSTALTSNSGPAHDGAADQSQPDGYAKWVESASQWMPSTEACDTRAEPPWHSLGLADAMTHLLCTSPALRQALATTSQREAEVIISDAARWPAWRANIDYNNYRNFNSSGSAGSTLGASVGLSWVMLDHGRRNADLRATRFAMASAQASRDATVDDQVLELLSLYGEAVMAQAAREAAAQARATSAQTAEAARARHEARVSSRIDRLQAQTAFAQARLAHVRASSAWSNARARLAQALGGTSEQPITLSGWEQWVYEAPELDSARVALAEEAFMQLPRMRASQAAIDAAQARLDAVKASHRGEVTFNASAGNLRNWGAAGNTTIPNGSASVVASFPLLSTQQANAEVSRAEQDLALVLAQREEQRRQLRLQLWEAQEALRASQEELRMSAELLANAEVTYEVAHGRYKAGVGSMPELLDAQAALADARRQRTQALVGRVTALTRLKITRSPGLSAIPAAGPDR
ncbi:TolC family protein [Hydrogenophaga sp. 5NK40-0174]|uniref:TolC family protein n=1 Tax=Hydrogenophaga sp. 5NK40-0174 TaxID=3127649 RepID=UPI003102DBF3